MLMQMSDQLDTLMDAENSLKQQLVDFSDTTQQVRVGETTRCKCSHPRNYSLSSVSLHAKAAQCINDNSYTYTFSNDLLL